MKTRVIVICVGIILNAKLLQCTDGFVCAYQATLPVDYDIEIERVLRINSGKVFEAVRNQCLDITLTNVSPNVVRRSNLLLENLDSSYPVIRIRDINDAMNGEWECDIVLPKVVIQLYFDLKVKDEKRINVEVNNMQLHYKTTNITASNYYATAVYEFEEDAYIDLRCSNIAPNNTRLIMVLDSNPGHHHSLKAELFGTAIRVTGWLTAHDANNVFIDCTSFSETQELRNFTVNISFELRNNKNDQTIKNGIIAYIYDTALIHDRSDLENTKLQYEYKFDFNETMTISCIRKYKSEGELIFSYKWLINIPANTPAPFLNSDLTIVQHTSDKIILNIKGRTITKDQTLTCQVKDSPLLQAEIKLIPKAGARQRACSLPWDSGTCRNYTMKFYFDIKYGRCAKFYYGGCAGNDNVFSTKVECENVCVNPSPKDACWLPKIQTRYTTRYDNVFRWYFDTTTKQCSIQNGDYFGVGNANNFESKELCETQCNPSKKIEITAEGTTENNFEKITILPDDGRTRYQTENRARSKETATEIVTPWLDGNEQTRNQTGYNARDKVNKETTQNIPFNKDFEKTTNFIVDDEQDDGNNGGSVVIIACMAGIIAATVGAGCIVFWLKRKKNIDTSKNEDSHQIYEEVYTTPGPQNASTTDSSIQVQAPYDYAYNIKINTLFEPSAAPDPCRRIKPKVGIQQENCSKSNDSSSSESNYYCEIDDYFVNKREAKTIKINLLKK